MIGDNCPAWMVITAPWFAPTPKHNERKNPEEHKAYMREYSRRRYKERTCAATSS